MVCGEQQEWAARNVNVSPARFSPRRASAKKKGVQASCADTRPLELGASSSSAPPSGRHAPVWA
jgi:hypothetical protein